MASLASPRFHFYDATHLVGHMALPILIICSANLGYGVTGEAGLFEY